MSNNSLVMAYRESKCAISLHFPGVLDFPVLLFKGACCRGLFTPSFLYSSSPYSSEVLAHTNVDLDAGASSENISHATVYVHNIQY